MSSTTDHSVRFGSIARTLIYEDHEGLLYFAFDLDAEKNPQTGKWTLYLERGALDADFKVVKPEPPRVDAAWERTKSYLLSCGYDVRTE